MTAKSWIRKLLPAFSGSADRRKPRKPHKQNQTVDRLVAAAESLKQSGLEVNPMVTSMIDRLPRMRTRDMLSYLQGVKENEWVAVALIRISDAVMFADWDIINHQTKEPLTDEEAPVIKLFKNPNPIQTWHDFLEQLIYFWLPAGNGFILNAERTTLGNPTKLWLLRPDRVRIVPDPIEFIKEYRYFSGATTGGIVLQREDVLHVKFAHPLDPYWGLGRIEASERAFNVDTASAEWAWRFFLNGAEPGVVLTSPNPLAEPTRERLQAQWEERHQGYKRAHSWTILDNGLKPEKMGMGPKEADFTESRKQFRQALLSLWGVPPIKAGIPDDVNRASAFVMEKTWQRDTIMPLLRRLQTKLTMIAKTFGPFEFAFHDLVVEDQEADAVIAEQYVRTGAITPNEARTKFAGFSKSDEPAMDRHYLPLGMVPIEDAGIPPPIEFSVPQREEQAAPKPEIKQDEQRVPPRGTPLQRRVLRFIVQSRAKQVMFMRREFAAFFRRTGEDVVRRLLGTGKSLMDDFKLNAQKGLREVFDSTADEKAWLSTSRGVFVDVLGEQYSLTVEVLGAERDLDFKPGNPKFDRRTQHLAALVTRVSAETQARLQEVILQGLDLGLSATQIANGNPDFDYPGIRGLFGDMAQNRSQLIARTESARAIDQANLEVYTDLGVQTCDVIGCQDFVIMPGQRWGCNSQGVPIPEANLIQFHPNHLGAIVPRITKSTTTARVLTALHRETILPGQEEVSLER